MYSKICNWCNELIEVEKQCLYALHICNCDSNPNKKERDRKNSEKFKGKRKVERIKLVKKCKKCDNEFIIEATESEIRRNKVKNYCSLRCGNSHKN